MKVQDFLILCLLINHVWTLSETDKDGKPCLFSETINITDGIKDVHGNIEFDGLNFAPENYAVYDYFIYNNSYTEKVEPHTRGCICSVTNCIRFCTRQATQIINVTTSTNGDYKIIDLYGKNYTYVYGRACNTMTNLQPKDEIFGFLNVSN